MLNYRELAALGFCPSKGYGWMKALPPGFELPQDCPHSLWPTIPLQIQIYYEQYENSNGVHQLKKV